MLDPCGISSIVMLLISKNRKYGLPSKYLFQRTQQYGNYTKPLGNDNFV